MTVAEFIELLQKYPQDAEVWYIEDFYGQLAKGVADYHIEMKEGKLVIGYC